MRQVRHQAQDEAAENEQHRVGQTELSGDDVKRRDHHQQQTDQLNLGHASTIKMAEGKRKKEEPLRCNTVLEQMPKSYSSNGIYS
jgi:hypothetical protein